MTPAAWLKRAGASLVFSLVLPTLGMAASSQAQGEPTPLLTAVEKEAGLTQWRQAIRQVDRAAEAPSAPEALADALAQDRQGTQKQLLESGVLADEHAWPAGCSAFRQVLEERLQAIATPSGIDEWVDWRNVYLVSCQADAARDTAKWQPLLTQKLEALPPETVGRAFAGVSPAQMSHVLLGSLPTSAWTCLAVAMPEAVRLGLDRHEGLRYVARSCQVADSVFGSAVSCLACGPHPRLSVGRTTRAVVSR